MTRLPVTLMQAVLLRCIVGEPRSSALHAQFQARIGHTLPRSSFETHLNQLMLKGLVQRVAVGEYVLTEHGHDTLDKVRDMVGLIA